MWSAGCWTHPRWRTNQVNLKAVFSGVVRHWVKVASYHLLVIELLFIHPEENLCKGPLDIFCHKEKWKCRLKNAKDKNLEELNSGELYFLAHKLAPAFLLEQYSRSYKLKLSCYSGCLLCPVYWEVVQNNVSLSSCRTCRIGPFAEQMNEKF